MNSIESFSTPKVGKLEGETKDAATALASDPAALEMLRAMMGNIAPPPATLSPTAEVGAKGDKDSTTLLALLTEALSAKELPPSLVKALATLKLEDAMDGQPADPALLAQALLKEITKGGSEDFVKELEKDLETELSKPDSKGLPASLTALAQGGSNPKAVQGAESDEATFAEAFAKDLTKPDATPRKPETPTSTPTQTQTSTPEPNEISLGQSILQSLGAQSSVTAAPTTGSTVINGAPTVERVEQVSALMTEMADRVLVSDPVHGQAQEVRVKLADNVMPGTELRISRDDAGQLRVAFETVSPYWARVLNEASPMLAQRLSERLPLVNPPQIVVEQHPGQPEDGRSRNRQDAWDQQRQSAEG